MQNSRREFLADVGKGMLLAGIGPALATDLGVGSVFAGETAKELTFGKLESLVALMQETPPAKLLPLAVQKLRDGTDLRTLVAAATLANVRTFGGEDYIGFHTMMALAPSYHMARELPAEKQALPVLKVLYRNSNRIQEKGGRKDEVLHTVDPAAVPENRNGEALRDAVRSKNKDTAERTFAALAKTPDDALNNLLAAVEDATEVHRVVMVYRAWDALDIVGKEQAHTMLRQSVRYCTQMCSERYDASVGGARNVIPKLLDQYKLLGKAGKRTAEDSFVEQLSQTIFKSTPEQAAEAAAAALAEGFTPDIIGEAISLATNQLVLRDNGRPQNQTSPNKPVGSIHGDSIGVHACDSANAWRNIAKVSNQRNTVICLMLGAYQAALDRIQRSGDFLTWEPYPRAEAREKVREVPRDKLLVEAEAAIKNKDQARAAALVHRCGALGIAARPVFDLLLRYAVSEDGALHAEKYYRTATEEYNTARPAFRWRQLIALSRVTASAYGQPAPGYADACRLLNV